MDCLSLSSVSSAINLGVCSASNTCLVCRAYSLLTLQQATHSPHTSIACLYLA